MDRCEQKNVATPLIFRQQNTLFSNRGKAGTYFIPDRKKKTQKNTQNVKKLANRLLIERRAVVISQILVSSENSRVGGEGKPSGRRSDVSAAVEGFDCQITSICSGG